MNKSKQLTLAQVKQFRRLVYDYYEASGRHDLPWRHTDNPYHIYVSEIMLQQTQVDRVREKHALFIAAFPDWGTLAAAPLASVLRLWQGLGYNRRGQNLWRAARMVVDTFGGVLPGTVQELILLPGIGPATAASVAAFAFNKPVVFIETNIRSVFIHHFFEDKSEVSDEQLLPLVEQCLDKKNPFVWYSALMDYGVHLKKTYGNPSRKSLHHAKQSRFDGSTRQVRGKVLKHLLDSKDGLSLVALEKAIQDPQGRVRAVTEELCREAIVSRQGRRYVAGGAV